MVWYWLSPPPGGSKAGLRGGGIIGPGLSPGSGSVRVGELG